LLPILPSNNGIAEFFEIMAELVGKLFLNSFIYFLFFTEHIYICRHCLIYFGKIRCCIRQTLHCGIYQNGRYRRPHHPSNAEIHSQRRGSRLLRNDWPPQFISAPAAFASAAPAAPLSVPTSGINITIIYLFTYPTSPVSYFTIYYFLDSKRSNKRRATSEAEATLTGEQEAGAGASNVAAATGTILFILFVL
jgi:hypothetical protein